MLMVSHALHPQFVCYGPEIELKFAFGCTWVAWRMKTCNRPGVIATFHLKKIIDLFWALTFASGHIMLSCIIF